MSNDPFNALETLYDCLKRMEATLLGMKQVRQYVGHGVGKEMLDSLIEEAEVQIADIKQKIIQ
jgi:methionine aminopeptidase